MSDFESDRVERTVSFADKDKQAQAICAFSNDLPNHRLPGYLFVGVDDRTGRPAGTSVTDRNLQSLAAIRSDGNVQPLPRMNVELLRHPDGNVGVVEVFPSDLPPVRYRGQIWMIRVGPRRAIANETEERVLVERRVGRARTWDARACRGSSVEDLALELFMVGYRQYAVAPETLYENNREVSDQLAALRFFDRESQCPTHAAILGSPLPVPDDVRDPHQLASLKHYRSLMPLAQDAHKPMFLLTAADGAIGGHAEAVADCYRDFKQLALRIADSIGISR
ncbi:MAG TPA: ATP-binding protein [Thermoanaerobaculia bacterium]